MPSWFVIVVRSFTIGLSARTSSTSASAVISSPGRVGDAEAPVDVEEHAARPGEVLGDERVQQARRDASLHDETAKAALGRERFVVVKWVAIAGHLREQFDVAGGHQTRAASGLTDLQHPPIVAPRVSVRP